MTRDDIRDMAREADVDWHQHWNVSWENEPTNRLEVFARLVAAREREACAKLCDDIGDPGADDAAAAIRKRGGS